MINWLLKILNIYDYKNPCSLGNGEYDHEPKCIDDSFDHEFGTEIKWHWECETCGEELEDLGHPDEYYGYDDYF